MVKQNTWLQHAWNEMNFQVAVTYGLVFLLGLLIGQGSNTIPFGWLGYFGWGIVAILGIMSFSILVLSFYYWLKESKVTISAFNEMFDDYWVKKRKEKERKE